MHPTITMYLAKAHAQDIEAEAARIQFAQSVRPQAPETELAAPRGLGLRRVIPMFWGKAHGAAAA